MNDNCKKIASAVLLCATAVCASALAFDKMYNAGDKKVSKGVLPYMMNDEGMMFGPPEFALLTRITLDDVVQDRNRNYSQKFTSLLDWELIILADYLRPYIETARGDPGRPMGSKMKKNYRERLFYTLFWLKTHADFKQMEFFFGWSESSLQEDIPHVLLAICRGLENFLQWPGAVERAALAREFRGIFTGCVGVIDATEIEIQKPVPRRLQATVSTEAQGQLWYLSLLKSLRTRTQ